MKNYIFKNAKFGERFLTRNGEIFSYLGKIESLFGNDSCHQGLIEDKDLMLYYNDEGKSLYAEFRGGAMNASDVDFTQVNCEEDCSDDIVARYQEPIDEDKLDELAIKNTPRLLIEENDGDNEFQWGFKVGYKKAKGL